MDDILSLFRGIDLEGEKMSANGDRAEQHGLN